MHKRITYFQVPVHNSVMVAVVDAFQDLLNTMGGIRLAVKFSRNDVLEKLSAGDSEKKLRDVSRKTDSKGNQRRVQGDALAVSFFKYSVRSSTSRTSNVDGIW